MPLKIPVPDQWRLNYPHFIGPPNALRCFFVFAIIAALITFLGAVVYYYEFDQNEIIEIQFVFNEGDDWECESIGVYNGEYKFLKDADTVPANLSESTSIAWVNSYNQMRNVNIDGNTFNMIRLMEHSETYNKDENSIFNVVRGNTATIDDCLEIYTNGACKVVNSSKILENINVYKFTVNIDFNETYPWIAGDNWQNHIDLQYLMLFQSDTINSSAKYPNAVSIFNTSYWSGGGDIEGYTYFHRMSNAEFWVAAKSDSSANLCSEIEDAIQKGEIEWGLEIGWEILDGGYSSLEEWQYPVRPAPNQPFFNTVSSVSLDVECERIAYDYCVVNATDQFAFTTPTSELRGTTLRRSNSNGGEENFILLSGELGATCTDRWQSVCETYWDIKGLCSTLYLPPFSCKTAKRKSYFTILSLSFASAELVFTVLIILVGCLIRQVANPVIEKDAVIQFEKNMERQMASLDNNVREESDDKEIPVVSCAGGDNDVAMTAM
eukprot:369460_1